MHNECESCKFSLCSSVKLKWKRAGGRDSPSPNQPPCTLLRLLTGLYGLQESPVPPAWSLVLVLLRVPPCLHPCTPIP